MSDLKIHIIRESGITVIQPATQGMIDREEILRTVYNRDHPDDKYAIVVGESLPDGYLKDGEWIGE